MWICENCQEEIKDKYKHCWNCGTVKPPTAEPEITYKRTGEKPIKSENSVKLTKVEPIKSEQTELKTEPPKEVKSDRFYEVKQIAQNELFSEYERESKNSSKSIIATIIPILIWLLLVGGLAYFANLSNQRTKAFKNQIQTEGQNFNQQKSSFQFPNIPLPDRKNRIVVDGEIKTKVLPLNKLNGEVADLFYVLPDDLRPRNIDEVKTIFWLECSLVEAGKFPDGLKGFQEKCNAYLVDREANKFIGIKDFLGVPPVFTKKTNNGDETGKVLAERYLAYLREKQPANERTELKDPTDSSEHHIIYKGEFFFAIAFLVILGAIGLGWLFFKFKSFLAQIDTTKL